MVLLTSSAISVVISSTVVCIFTFLLFLSGYVLQQQTVRSLQEALHRPPPPQPTLTLPEKFRQGDENYSTAESDGQGQFIEVTVTAIEKEPPKEALLGIENAETQGGSIDLQSEAHFTSPAESAAATLSSILSQPSEISTTLSGEPSLAYVLALSNPSEICSAVLFFKWQRQFGLQSPSLLLLYPSLWEDTSTSAHTAALSLMRDAQDTYQVILHPVAISTVWEGVSIESQLLAEIQRSWMRWGFDRTLYLRSPGLGLDVSRLDSALKLSSLKTSWTPLSSSPQDLPGVMLMALEKAAIMVPRGNMRGLTAEAMTGKHEEHHSKEIEVEAKLANEKAGYVIFDQAELDHRRKEKEWYSGIFERFERGRKEVCDGVNFDGKGEKEDGHGTPGRGKEM